MIGGEDHVTLFRDTPVLRRYVESYARTLWPDCVIDTEQEGEQFVLYVFRDADARKAWEQTGGTDDNQPTLFAVYFSDATTIVTGSGSPIGPELRANIEQHACFEGFVRT
jgi:hypothetical protein